MILTAASGGPHDFWVLVVGAHFLVQAFRYGGNYAVASIIAGTCAVLTLIFFVSRHRGRRHASR